MTTRRLRIALALLFCCSTATNLQAAPLGQPTPCPCTVEGCCIPVRESWGYEKTKWRRWPGAETASTSRPGAGASQGGPQLDVTVKPAPEFEDQAAPEKIEELDPDSEDRGRESDIDLPEFSGPDDESPNARSPSGEGDGTPAPRPRVPRPSFMDDVPGGFPFDDPPAGGADEERVPFGQPPAAPTPAPTPAGDLFPYDLNPQQGGGQLGDDAPPPLPFADAPHQRRRPATRRQARPSSVQQASFQQASFVAPNSSQPRAEINQAPLRRLGPSSDAPPVLPAMFQSPAGR